MAVNRLALRRAAPAISGLVAAAALLLAVPATAWGAYSITGAWSGQIIFHIQNTGDTFTEINLTAPMGVNWTGAASVNQVGGTCGHTSTVLGCQGLSVANGQSIDITAMTSPSPVPSSTVFSATVDDTTTFSGPFMIGMASPPPAPSVQLAPAMLDFGSVPIGTTSAPKVVTLTNSGGATLNIGSLTVTMPFAIPNGGDGCGGKSIAPNGQCKVSIVFSPTAGGLLTGTLKFADDASDSPQTVDLSGTGSPAPTCPGFPELGRPCADVFITFTKPPKSVYGKGQVVSFAYAAGNNGPDPSEISIQSVVLIGGGIDSSSKVTLPAPTSAQGSNVESGGVFVNEKGSATIERIVSGSVPDPVGSNNSVDATVDVYPFPDSTAEPPGADVKGGGGGQLGGSTDSCGEAKPPGICSGGDDECVDKQGCVQSHHDVCEQPTGELGVCGPPPPAVCAPSAATCSSPKLAQRPVLGRAAPPVPSAVHAASGFNPALERVSKVRVALVAVGKGGHAAAAKPCRWLTAKGKLRGRACNKPVWVKAKGTTHWKLHVPPLPRGSYVAYVQAANAAGIAEDTFGPKDHNRIAFRVR